MVIIIKKFNKRGEKYIYYKIYLYYAIKNVGRKS